MLYRATRWKLEGLDLRSFKQDMVSTSRRRTFTSRTFKVDIPVPIVDQREVAFRYFTEIASIDRKRKNKRGYHLKHHNSNKFLAWLGMSANDSSAVVASGCDSTGVSVLTKHTTPNRLLLASSGNVSKINQQMKILETTGDLELCTSLYHLKHHNSNTFLAWLGMSANDSSAVVASGCDSTGVSVLTKHTTPNRLLLASSGNVSKINQQMKILETAGDLELCTSLPSNDFRPMTVMNGIEHGPIVENCGSEMTQLTHKGRIKQVDIDLIVAMLKNLSLDNKRKIKESEKEHFEIFQAHRPFARPYAKKMKVSNN